jgi:tyrosine ammonia-lyase
MQERSRWQEMIFSRFKQEGYPLFIFDNQIMPAASLWTGSRLWCDAFRAHQIGQGTRVVLALPPSIEFIQVMLAGLWEGVSFVLCPPDSTNAPDQAAQAARQTDATVIISNGEGHWNPSGICGPSGDPVKCKTVHAPSPDVRFLLRGTGTTKPKNAATRWICLSDANIWSVLDTHIPALNLKEQESRVLSTLPWHHAFGLILELLPAMIVGTEIWRPSTGARDIDALIKTAKDCEATHFFAVPLTIRRLLAHPEGASFLQSLEGGIIGGATITQELLPILSQTKLRVGYGQSEAAPGICLGEPGEFPAAGYLGKPLGCEVRLSKSDALQFRGANRLVGVWGAEGFAPTDNASWQDTRDIVTLSSSGGLLFVARADDNFKMANGRFIEAALLEARLRRQFPTLGDALLYSPDGTHLTLAMTGDTPVVATLQEALGACGPLLTQTQIMHENNIKRTPKGDISRHATVENLHQKSLSFGPDVEITCEDVERVGLQSLLLQFTPLGENSLADSYKNLQHHLAINTPLYGTTTGFGPFIECHAHPISSTQGSGLIAHLGAGWSPVAGGMMQTTNPSVVRGAMAIRLQNLVQGCSGIAPDVAHAYKDFLETGETPVVPLVGSVGASGDLIPLAHIVQAFQSHANLTLAARDCLALTNGTSLLTSYMAIATARAERLFTHAEVITGWLYRAVGAQTDALDPRLHAKRGHVGQCESAANIRTEALRFGEYDVSVRPLQEIYSLRTAPQVLGACRDNLNYARQITEREINGVSDNPLIFADTVLHGGNFQGQQVAFAADALNAALLQAAILAERQLDALTTPGRYLPDTPLLLAWNPGATSGLAGAQITATSLVAEMRAHAQMHATFSISTNGGNQDIVSMGTLAARMAYEQTERLSAILGILTLALHQLGHLRDGGKMAGNIAHAPTHFPTTEPIVEDRPLYPEIQAFAQFFLG